MARSSFKSGANCAARSTIATAFLHLARSGELWANLSASLEGLFWGFLLGGVPALLLGLAMGLYRPVRALIEPLVAATYPIPKSAILPLILLIFGLGEASKIAMVALGVFYPMIINTRSEEHTSELQSRFGISYAVFCLKK